jgi:hypothetical protein
MLQKIPQCVDQQPRIAARARFRRAGDHDGHVLPFSVEPGVRRGRIGEGQRVGDRAGRTERWPGDVEPTHPGGFHRAAEIVVEEAVQTRLSVLRGILFPQALDGVLVD